MNREELEGELDKWLDKATVEYGSTEERPGLEARILANVNSRLADRRRHFQWLSLATAAMAILILSCFALLTRIEDRPAIESTMQREQRSGLPPIAQQERPSSIVQAESAAKRQVTKNAPISAGETAKRPFLSGELSEQERYLMLFIKTVSAQKLAGESETESGPLPIPHFELSSIQIPKAQVSSINIDMVQLPVAHRNEDPL